MPLATRPNAHYEHVLSADKDLPKKNRPIFIFRYLSLLDWESVAALSEKLDESTDSKQMTKWTIEIIGKTLVGWENLTDKEGKPVAFSKAKPMSFNIKQLKLLITIGEATELMMAGVSQRPSADDLKKSE